MHYFLREVIGNGNELLFLSNGPMSDFYVMACAQKEKLSKQIARFLSACHYVMKTVEGFLVTMYLDLFYRYLTRRKAQNGQA